MAPLALSAPAEAPTGTAIPIQASTSDGVPATYEVQLYSGRRADEPEHRLERDADDVSRTFQPSIGSSGEAVAFNVTALAAGSWDVRATFSDVLGGTVTKTKRIKCSTNPAAVRSRSPAGGVHEDGGRDDRRAGHRRRLRASARWPSPMTGSAWTTRSYARQPGLDPSGHERHQDRPCQVDDAPATCRPSRPTRSCSTRSPRASTEPRRGLVAATNIDAGRITLRVPWSGTDATSGIARYELLQSTDGGAWTTVSTTLTSPTADRSLASLHTYRFRVRAVDKAGNVGPWVFGTPFWLVRYSEFNSAITYSGSWSTVSSAAYWGGAAKTLGHGRRKGDADLHRALGRLDRPDRPQPRGGDGLRQRHQGRRPSTCTPRPMATSASYGHATGRPPPPAPSRSGWPAPAGARWSMSTPSSRRTRGRIERRIRSEARSTYPEFGDFVW